MKNLIMILFVLAFCSCASNAQSSEKTSTRTRILEEGEVLNIEVSIFDVDSPNYKKLIADDEYKNHLFERVKDDPNLKMYYITDYIVSKGAKIQEGCGIRPGEVKLNLAKSTFTIEFEIVGPPGSPKIYRL